MKTLIEYSLSKEEVEDALLSFINNKLDSSALIDDLFDVDIKGIAELVIVSCNKKEDADEDEKAYNPDTLRREILIVINGNKKGVDVSDIYNNSLINKYGCKSIENELSYLEDSNIVSFEDDDVYLITKKGKEYLKSLS